MDKKFGGVTPKLDQNADVQSLDKMPSVKQVSSQHADPIAGSRGKDQLATKASDVKTQIK